MLYILTTGKFTFESNFSNAILSALGLFMAIVPFGKVSTRLMYCKDNIIMQRLNGHWPYGELTIFPFDSNGKRDMKR